MPRPKASGTKSTISKTKKRPVASSTKKKTASWPPSFWKRYMMPILFVTGFAIVGGIIMLVSSRAATPTGTILSSVAAKKCLDNNDSKQANNNKITLWDCDGTPAQQWTLSGDTITTGKGYCLDVKGGSKASKTLVQLYKCNGTGAQKWSVKSNGSIVNPQSGLCLDDQYAKTANGNPIWIYTCNGTNAQKWTVPTATPSTPTTPTPKPTPDPTPTPTPTPPTSSNNPSGQAMPGAVAGWKLIFADDFTGNVPVGAFSDCNHNTDTPQAYCGGLKAHGAYYNNWWAYPNNWDDTAKSGADGNTGAPFGGRYHPEDTVSVSNGAMHVKMFRPKSGGDNHVAALVPRKCMDRQYGRYVERFKVVQADPGFKSAHLFYNGGYEIDYPENDFGDQISAYTHPGGANFSTGAKYTTWHTTAIEWTASSVKFYMDGKLVGTTTNKVPKIKMSWILQNESSIMGPYAKPGATAQIDTDWIACYAPN